MAKIAIVGSGVGGAQTALELAKKGHDVEIYESGDYSKLGTETRATSFYTGGYFGPGEFSEEGVEFLRTNMVGGSSVVTIANAVKSLERELSSIGINLEKEYKEIEQEIDISECPIDKMGQRTKLLMNASERLGYDMVPMPKFIDFSRCEGCGNCALGCVRGAKWTSRNVIGEAYRYGLKLHRNHRVNKVIHENGEVTGLQMNTPSGTVVRAADIVILAAGGLGTPVILQNSGIDSGSHLFGDLFIDTFGVFDKADFGPELGMAAIIDEFHERDGYILSPFMEGQMDLLTNRVALRHKLSAFRTNRLVGIMAKTKDEASGAIDQNGRISKPLSEGDRVKIDKGFERSKELLIEAGANPGSIFRSHVRAAHPGGTAGVGRVVNIDLETEVNGLFVCDASVLPEAPGKPPVLAILALAKYFAKKLIT